MPLISRNKFPPGGWKFKQPQTGWDAPTPFSDNFDSTVKRIIAMRRNNPRFNLSTVREDVEMELENYTCTRIKNDPQYCKDVESLKKNSQPSLPHMVAARLAENVGQTLRGGDVLLNWLGSGGTPVAHSLAERRAAICCLCPLNVKKGSFSITGSVANMIRKTLSLKSELKLETSWDQQLHTCDACGCNLPLKVHVPLDYILQEMTDEDRVRLDPICWILSEV